MVIRIIRQPPPMLIMIDQKQPEDVRYFNYLGSMITNDARCLHMKLNPGLVLKKQHSTRTLFSPADWT
jgi:hypothetical protein